MLESAARTPDRGTEGKALAATALVTSLVSVTLGFALGNKWVLPALNALFIFPFFLSLVARGQRRRAVALVCLWALFMSEFVIAATIVYPERASAVIVRGETYRQEMFDWVRTGKGTESSPSRFIPAHLKELVVFSVLAFLTAGLGALFLGAVLLNYMNYYVGALLASAAHPVATAFLGWQPYAVIRVVGYILIATALSEWGLRIISRQRTNWRRIARFGAIGLALVVLDMLVKASVAELWARMLRSTTGL